MWSAWTGFHPSPCKRCGLALRRPPSPLQANGLVSLRNLAPVRMWSAWTGFHPSPCKRCGLALRRPPSPLQANGLVSSSFPWDSTLAPASVVTYALRCLPRPCKLTVLSPSATLSVLFPLSSQSCLLTIACSFVCMYSLSVMSVMPVCLGSWDITSILSYLRADLSARH
eukprot:COSAG04_NODE_3855_length_2471_cov_3.275717_1_plen_169_part_00